MQKVRNLYSRMCWVAEGKIKSMENQKMSTKPMRDYIEQKYSEDELNVALREVNKLQHKVESLEKEVKSMRQQVDTIGERLCNIWTVLGTDQ